MRELLHQQQAVDSVDPRTSWIWDLQRQLEARHLLAILAVHAWLPDMLSEMVSAKWVPTWSNAPAGPASNESQDPSASDVYDDYEDGSQAAAPQSIIGGIYEGEHTDDT